MKIKQPIYLAAAVAGFVLLIAGPSLLGKEYGLAAGFVLLFFGIYGVSRKVMPATSESGTDAPKPVSGEGSADAQEGTAQGEITGSGRQRPDASSCENA
jgi:hypothetical protein